MPSRSIIRTGVGPHREPGNRFPAMAAINLLAARAARVQSRRNLSRSLSPKLDHSHSITRFDRSRTGPKRRLRQPEEVFLRKLQENPPVRLPGTAVFLTPATTGMPVFLILHLTLTRVMHERVLLISVLTLEEPRVDDANWVEVIPIGAGISRVILRYG